MRSIGWAAAAALLVCACATSNQKPPETKAKAESAPQAKNNQLNYVDPTLGFEISRPQKGWHFEPGQNGPEGIAVPVVVVHEETGSQVVVQVTPHPVPPSEFAQELALGLASKQGFKTSSPKEEGPGHSTFLFALGDQVFGKVGVIGANQRTFVLLATWPADAPQTVLKDIDGIMQSLHTSTSTASVASCPPGKCIQL